jgi:L-ascorbate oxidase
MDHANMGAANVAAPQTMDGSSMQGMDHSNMATSAQPAVKDMDHAQMPSSSTPVMNGMDHAGMAMSDGGDPFYAPGSGLTPEAYNGGKFLSYTDLRAARPRYRRRAPSRTGNMERYIWSINGVKYDDADPIVLNYGERVRIRFINETMMAHPMHLHGMWSIVDTGQGSRNPIKHTVSVQPGVTTDIEVEVDAPGQWAFHCHLSYHADGGMFRKVVVKGRPA